MIKSFSKKMNNCLAFALCLFALLKPTILGADEVKIELGWEYSNFPAQIELFELKNQRAGRLWETKSVKSYSELPPSRKYNSSSFVLNTGENRKFMLVINNSSAQDLHFFAAPHMVSPQELSLGFKFKCLCINHAFRIPARHVWYRVVELRVSKNVLSRELKISHTIAGITKEQQKNFKIKRLPSL